MIQTQTPGNIDAVRKQKTRRPHPHLDHSLPARTEKNMPVKINVRSAEDYAATDSRFDATVRRLAPNINQLREDSARRSTRKLADRLNGMGMTGPNGKPLSYTTMRRILERLPELHLGGGPSNRKRAASDRRMPYRYRPGRQSGFSGLKQTLADIAKAES
jgi:hypothetical protein